MREALRSWGYVTDIYTYSQDEGVVARDFAEWSEGEPGDVVIFDYPMDSPMNDAFKGLSCKRVLLYHNITPSEFLAAWDGEIARILVDDATEVQFGQTLFGVRPLQGVVRVPPAAGQ